MPDIHYRSAVRPWDDFTADKPTTLYFGVVQRLSRESLDRDGHDAVLASVQKMTELIRPRRLSDGVVVEPAISSMAIERYDAYALDQADSDILVFWRIPLKPVRP